MLRIRRVYFEDYRTDENKSILLGLSSFIRFQVIHFMQFMQLTYSHIMR